MQYVQSVCAVSLSRPSFSLSARLPGRLPAIPMILLLGQTSFPQGTVATPASRRRPESANNKGMLLLILWADADVIAKRTVVASVWHLVTLTRSPFHSASYSILCVRRTSWKRKVATTVRHSTTMVEAGGAVGKEAVTLPLMLHPNGNALFDVHSPHIMAG